jgi:hypothetical protein
METRKAANILLRDGYFLPKKLKTANLTLIFIWHFLSNAYFPIYKLIVYY